MYAERQLKQPLNKTIIKDALIHPSFFLEEPQFESIFVIPPSLLLVQSLLLKLNTSILSYTHDMVTSISPPK